MSWPKEIQDLIISTFGNDDQKAYGQISTVSPEHRPSVRTVHIHAITVPIQALIVSCNTQSEKWREIQTNPWVAGCFWKPSDQTQFRFEGKARLIFEDDLNYADLVLTMWMKMREEVRTTYLLDDQGINLKTETVDIDPMIHSKHHGILLITPHRWDLFYNDVNEYRLGKRTIYENVGNVWESRQVNSLHEQNAQ